jgi:hypothetical protein
MTGVKFSYDQAWQDGVALARAHGSLLLAITGVFLLLPQFAQGLFFPPPEIRGFDQSAIEALSVYFQDNWIALFLLNLPVALGQAAILSLLLDPEKPTVGQALSISATLLLSIIVLNLILNLMIFGGILMFIVPGIYLIGRLSVAASAQMAERISNPIVAVQRSMRLTDKNGFEIAGIIILIVVVGYIIAVAIGAVIGILLTLMVPMVAANASTALLQAILASLTMLVLTILSAAIYVQCAADVKQGM